jgi:hypothetical protein
MPFSGCFLSVNHLFPSSKSTLHYFSINAGGTEVPAWSEVRADNTEGREKTLRLAADLNRLITRSRNLVG